MPRKMELDELISVLITEHIQIKSGLEALRNKLAAKDFASAKDVLSEVKGVFSRHIADEEAQVLRILIDAYGVKGANEAIEVFRQHRPIHDLMETIEHFSDLSALELESKEVELRSLLDKHTKIEESRIYPWTLSTYKMKHQG